MADVLAQVIWRMRALVRPPVTLGVRCVVMDTRRRVLLVRHTYMNGWHFPGGGVDPGESARQAAVRETREETGVVLTADPAFFGFYWNRNLAQRDHVAVYVARDHPPVNEADLLPQATEIAEARFVSVDALPEGMSAPTLRRIGELFHGEPASDVW